MRSDKKMLLIAVETASANDRIDNRAFFLGAIGIRQDGVIVKSRNIASTEKAPNHHAESRLSRKLTPKSTVWVARVSRDGTWALARPCLGCQIRLRAVGVKRVVYTISQNEWGIMLL